MEDIIKIIKSLEDSGLLTCISQTIANESKEQKGGPSGMLLGPLGVSLLGNLLAGTGVIRAGDRITQASEGTIRTGQGF